MSVQFELTVTRDIPAPRKAVFEAWLTPEALVQFMTPLEGMSVAKAESEAQEGGRFLIVMKAGEDEMPHRGEYRTIQRHERLVFTWETEWSSPGSLVSLTFAEQGPEATKLTLHHLGFPDQESCTNHTDGWTTILACLEATLNAG